MSLQHNKKIADLERRQANTVSFGTITAINPKSGRYRVKIGDIETDWLPNPQIRAGKTRNYESLDIGEQVVIVAQSGDLYQGAIIGALNTKTSQPANKANLHTTIYPDDSQITYDDQTHQYSINLNPDGAFELNVDDGATIKGGKEKLELKLSQTSLNITNESLTLKCGNTELSLTDDGVKINSNFDVEKDTRLKGSLKIEGKTVSHQGKNIGKDHKHKGVKPGPSTTGEPV